MRLRFVFLVASLGLNASARAAAPGWTFTNLSDLLPDQPRFPATRQDRAPSAQAEGVVWVAYNPMVSRPLFPGGNAIAFWDRNGVRYLTPYPPDWSWTGVWALSACGAHVAFPLEAIWPPDARPGDPWYIYSEMFYLEDRGLHRITFDQASEHALPSLHQGTIAWQTRRAQDPWIVPLQPDDWEIRYWDGYGVRPVTDNGVDDTDPSLYGRTIAWCCGTMFPESMGNILYLSVPPPGDPGPLPPPVVVGPGAAPSLFKNKIAYHAFDGSDTEILLFDIVSGQTIQVTDNDRADRNPSLFEDTIAWESGPAEEWYNADIFYWDGTTTHQLTQTTRYHNTTPSLWGTGLNTTIAYIKLFRGTAYSSRVVCVRRALLSVVQGPLPGEVTVTWPSLEARTYRVEYSGDLLNWHIAAEAVPSAGYGETSWTDGPGSGTVRPPSSAPQRFYRVCEKE